MSDIILKAVDEAQKDERVATGTVEGVQVELQKEEYRSGNDTYWRVSAVTPHRDGPTKAKGPMGHGQADELFRNLKRNYDLTEDEDV